MYSVRFFVILVLIFLPSCFTQSCPSCPAGQAFRYGGGCEQPAYSLQGVTRIHDIQGAKFSSDFENKAVTTVGVVTAIARNGFYIQDVYEDCNETTSEAIFVFSSPPDASRAVGQAVKVKGVVKEFVAKNRDGDPEGLVITELSPVTEVTVVTAGPIAVAPKEFSPPSTLSKYGSYERTLTQESRTNILDVRCDSLSDALCYYEAYEGMLVKISDPIAVGSTLKFGEIAVSNGRLNPSLTNSYGGLVLQPANLDSFGGDVILVEDGLGKVPYITIGSALEPIQGVVDFNFGSPKIKAISDVKIRQNFDLNPARCKAMDDKNNLRVGSFNLENFCAGDKRLANLTSFVAKALDCPHVIGLEEIGDDSCDLSDEVVTAKVGLSQVKSAMNQLCPGKAYEAIEIPPVNGQDGGKPGINIRQAVLFDSNKLSFSVRVPGGLNPSVTGTEVKDNKLSINPGRISPNDPALRNSRKPLVVEFEYSGRKVYLLVHHWNSKGGDDSLWSEMQPPRQSSQGQRNQIQKLVSKFITGLPSDAILFSVGDYNDFYFSEPMKNFLTESGPLLANLWNKLPASERYSYFYQGRFQTLDHIVVQDRYFANCNLCVHHGNSVFGARQLSDHDPIVAECKGLGVDTEDPVIQSPTPTEEPVGSTDATGSAFFNELYIQAGTSRQSTASFVEIAGNTTRVDLQKLKIVLYDDRTGDSLQQLSFEGEWLNVVNDFGFASVELPSGSRSTAFALVSPTGTLEFISIEKSVTAANGPAAGKRSVPIGLNFSASQVISVGRSGKGKVPSDFSWQVFAEATRGRINDKQSLGEAILPAFINEFHYDNDGNDRDEFVEVAGPSDVATSSYKLLFYSGSNKKLYNTVALSGNWLNIVNGYGFASVSVTGLQNGPDGIALLGPEGVIEFISYEGTFTAVDGAAAGKTSKDIGVSESSNAVPGSSVGRISSGRATGDFRWVAFKKSSRNSINAGQSI